MTKCGQNKSGDKSPHSKWRLILAAALAVACTGRAAAAAEPEFTAIRAGFSGNYKVGLWTPLEATVRGGSNRVAGRVRASLTDSDGLICTFDAAEPCELAAGQETKVPLYVRYGHESSSVTLELLDGAKAVASRTFTSAQGASSPLRDALRPGRRLIVVAGATPHGLDGAVPNSQGKAARNVVATVDDFADLPDRWQGYEGVDFVILAAGRPEIYKNVASNDARIEALDQWVHAGGSVVLTAGEHADEVLLAGSPLARFLPGRYETMRRQGKTGGWEMLAKSANPIPPPSPRVKVQLPTAKLVDVEGRIEASEDDVPLVVRHARGLGQVVFVATDLDRGPVAAWSDRPLLLAAILGLPADEPLTEATNSNESYGFDDLAGQLRSSLEVFRDVKLVPFFVVAILLVVYVLLIGPGDYFLLRRLRGGMRGTWITFPAVVVLFAAGAYWSSSWLKGDAIRVNQVDLVDIAADGTARGASWFSIFSPRSETFDLSLRPRLPDGEPPQSQSTSLAWFGKAGNGFNGMYGRDAENASPLWSQGYSISPPLDSIANVPVQVASCKNFVYRWLGRAADQGLNASLHEENGQPAGTVVNSLNRSGGQGVTLTHAYLAYEGWAYALGTLEPGKAVEIDSSTRRVSLKTFVSSEAFENIGPSGGQPDKVPYDQASRAAAYVLRAMMFYNVAGGRKYTGMANDYQGFVDFSGLLRTGRAVLVAMPPQEDAFRGAELLKGPMPQADEADARQPLAGPLDRRTIIYRFVVSVGKSR